MSHPAKFPVSGVLAALAAFAIFSTHDVFVKYLGGQYAPQQIIFFSVLFGFPLATIMLIRDPVSGHLRPVHPWWTALRTAAGVLTGLSAFYAFSVLPLAQTYAILFASPLLITVLSIPVLGEKVGAHRWLAVVAGLIGVLVVLRPGAAELTLGHLAALTAAIGSALAAVVVRKIGKDERSAVLMIYPLLANLVIMGCFLPGIYRPMPLDHLALVFLISLFGFGAGLLVIFAYRRTDAAIVAPMQYSQILWAALFGVLFFDERPDVVTWIGAAIIIASGLYIVLRESLAGASRNRPVSRNRGRFTTSALPSLMGMAKVTGGGPEGLAKRVDSG